MKDTLYIVFNSLGIDRGVKNAPVLKPGEYLTQIKLSVPDHVFKPSPMPVIEIALDGPQIRPASVIVNGDAVDLPKNITEADKRHTASIGQLAKLIKAARSSTDPAMQGLADDALDDLISAGVEVRIVSE